MVKQIILCFVVAIAMTVAGAALCQSEGFKLHYCAMIFVTVFGATICTCAFWDGFRETLEGYDAESKRSIIGDTIASTIMAWLLPVSIFLVGVCSNG